MYHLSASQAYLEDAPGYHFHSCFCASSQGCHPWNVLSSCYPALPCLLSFAMLTSSQPARGRKQGSLVDSFRTCSCLSGSGRWGNPWRADLSSHPPRKTACQSGCAACVGSQAFSKRNQDEFSNYICFREGIFPLTYLFSSAVLQPLGIKSTSNFSSVFGTCQKSLKTLAENRLQSFQWTKCPLGDFHFFNMWGLSMHER